MENQLQGIKDDDIVEVEAKVIKEFFFCLWMFTLSVELNENAKIIARNSSKKRKLDGKACNKNQRLASLSRRKIVVNE